MVIKMTRSRPNRLQFNVDLSEFPDIHEHLKNQPNPRRYLVNLVKLDILGPEGVDQKYEELLKSYRTMEDRVKSLEGLGEVITG